ncbi:hypothetical protein AB1Y20_022645 [Prymnesium parvum]|uniref:Uncharacterized protein n=1 Tax=Prymnesium parvum TaxID=97485 RepID=A0AB34JGX2_PRYPA
MAYLWQPGEEKGTISIEKTSCQNIRNVTTAPKSDSKSAQQNEFKIELTHYRVLAHLYQCFEVRYSSIIGLEKTEKFCFPAVNLDMLPRNFVFDAAQPTPSGENSSEGADEHEEEDREEEDSEDEVVEVRAPKGQNVKKGQKDLKAQKGVKAVKEVKVKEEKETHGHPPW